MVVIQLRINSSELERTWILIVLTLYTLLKFIELEELSCKSIV